MNKQTVLAIAQAIIALLTGDETEPTAPVSTEPEKPRRGRKPKEETAPGATTTEEQAPEPEKAKDEQPTVNVEDERQRLRKLFEPLVVAQKRGGEVVACIKKYGVETLGAMDPQHFAAFEADIQALLM